MGNGQSTEHSRALVKIERQNENLVRLNQQLKEQHRVTVRLQHQMAVQKLDRVREMLRFQLEMMKKLSELREEIRRREKEHQEYVQMLFMIIGFLLFLAVCLNEQKQAAIHSERNCIIRLSTNK